MFGTTKPDDPDPYMLKNYNTRLIDWAFDGNELLLLNTMVDSEYGEVFEQLELNPNPEIKQKNYGIFFQFSQPLTSEQHKELYKKAQDFSKIHDKNIPPYLKHTKGTLEFLAMRIRYITISQTTQGWKP